MNIQSITSHSMHSREGDRFAVLQAIEIAGSVIRPRWDSKSALGFIYEGTSGPLSELDIATLDWLADRNYLERIFFDRLAHCPDCGSRHLNFRELCVSCSSANVASVELLHHFRCGYVAPITEFYADDDSRRCPKCHGRVRDRGTDHDVPGPHFSCRDCLISFQLPDLGAVCLQCQSRIDSDRLPAIVYIDVVAYRLTSLAKIALKNGQLFTADPNGGLMEPHLPVYKRQIFMEFVEDERRRFKRFGTPFTLLLVTSGDERLGTSKRDPLFNLGIIERLRDLLDETDKLGLYNDDHIVALLPGTNEKQAKRVIKLIANDSSEVLRQNNVGAKVVRMIEGMKTVDSLTTTLGSASRLA